MSCDFFSEALYRQHGTYAFFCHFANDMGVCVFWVCPTTPMSSAGTMSPCIHDPVFLTFLGGCFHYPATVWGGMHWSAANVTANPRISSKTQRDIQPSVCRLQSKQLVSKVTDQMTFCSFRNILNYQLKQLNSAFWNEMKCRVGEYVRRLRRLKRASVAEHLVPAALASLNSACTWRLPQGSWSAWNVHQISSKIKGFKPTQPRDALEIHEIGWNATSMKQYQSFLPVQRGSASLLDPQFPIGDLSHTLLGSAIWAQPTCIGLLSPNNDI